MFPCIAVLFYPLSLFVNNPSRCGMLPRNMYLMLDAVVFISDYFKHFDVYVIIDFTINPPKLI